MTTKRKWKRAKTPPLRPEQVRAVVRHRDGYRCVDCGMTAMRHIEKYGKNLDVHRVIPGTPYAIKNCITVCRRCHGAKPKSPRRSGGENGRVRLVLLVSPVRSRALHIRAIKDGVSLSTLINDLIDKTYAGELKELDQLAGKRKEMPET